ncbi:hypothetical protein SARC_07537 [Sphaeroforma arctica JP610]|uniref:EGF-like domain-containing protein n=1 Tax=Sphaeroforma arctica JP610 TaxID=667725 RepID=A0A0L0FTX4_9EUKA|nr:hypothetical protein SARC_07537 [Sphaeroforma arctica JP610]KNC80094.1 hypothetical protein SARC_07537 [Sphaeroforma arctica JP610]|eukprot:XP_014153996.1 hypothetical protein SARC_07537 [Sphaeroforma arctica JP610]
MRQLISTTEIDECLESEHNCRLDTECFNTPGSFTCACDEGYIGNGTVCEDIDDASRKTTVVIQMLSVSAHLAASHAPAMRAILATAQATVDPEPCEILDLECDSQAQCLFTGVGYDCVCNEGFFGNVTACKGPKDECKASGQDCDINAECLDVGGSFMCTCQEGFIGNSMSCTDCETATDIPYCAKCRSSQDTTPVCEVCNTGFFVATNVTYTALHRAPGAGEDRKASGGQSGVQTQAETTRGKQGVYNTFARAARATSNRACVHPLENIEFALTNSDEYSLDINCQCNGKTPTAEDERCLVSGNTVVFPVPKVTGEYRCEMVAVAGCNIKPGQIHRLGGIYKITVCEVTE